MSNFFSRNPAGAPFREFSPVHFAVIFVLAAAVFATIFFARKIRANAKLTRRLPFILGGVAWTLEVAFHIWNFVTHNAFLENLVPLELCSISLLLSVVLVLTDSRRVFEFYYFVSIGALMAVLFPSYGGYGPGSFRFWHFFFVHCFTFWLNIYYLAVRGYRLRKTSFLSLLAIMVPLSFFVRFIDRRFDRNYMFLNGTSGTTSPLDFLGTSTAYFYKLALLAISIFFVLYLVGPKYKPQESDQIGECEQQQQL
ncbi:MAG: TIGR02206 family membrane protein [Oscillospiraceae bacterium]|jgi:hypothetical integral membrane protein (TIGR02206 family)|nr:TIGR02206 family membrane protein [Oscillospiraceae bacterium]